MDVGEAGSSLRAVDERELAAVVRAAVGRPIDVAGWTCRSLGPVNAASATAGLWRFASADRYGADAWSVVLKVLHHATQRNAYWPSSDDPADPMYWKREALAYQSRTLRPRGGAFRAAQCFGAIEQPDGTIHLWLEDVQGARGVEWEVERFAVAARHLGAFQGRFLAGEPLPSDAWLSRGWFRAYVARRTADLQAPPPEEAWEHPLVQRAFAENVWPRVARAWAERDRTLDLLSRVPQTVCHHDFWPPNIFDQDGRTVAIDWAYAGIDAVGEDAANLGPDTMLDFFVDARTHAETLTEQIFAGYLAGLRDAGAPVPREVLRFVFTAFASLKYLWMVPRLLAAARDPARLAAMQGATGLSAEAIFEQRGAVMLLLLRFADEARALAPEIERAYPG